MSRPFDDATRAQIDAARPDVSTWLTANAGSGKTRVLTDRVARLLLAEVEPQQILCLTYTKAAASEMQNRLFKRLGEWAMLEDAALQSSLAELGIETDFDPAKLRQARTLFARAIETPGGLKIQTIHSFCAAILRRFPLEAEVNPQFTEIEDRAADLLRADIVDEIADSADAHVIANLARYYTGEDFSSLTRKIVSLRDAFEGALTRDQLLALFEQSADLSWQSIENDVFLGSELALIKEIVPVLLAKGGMDAKAAQVLSDFDSPSVSALPLLERVFLTGSGAKSPFTAKIGSFPTKPTQAKIDSLMPQLDNFMMRVEEARDARLALATVEKTLVLHQFATHFLQRYETAKMARGWLDFDDLILKTRALLSNKKVAAWVLYRIDGGIDHILVDEAQDTSPQQWDVIERLADEFHSGEGTRPDLDRTLFVVGDKKQSIYSFQGADPEAFDQKGRAFEEKIRAANKTFQHRSLDYSFRSSSAILRLVDHAFDARVQDGLVSDSKHLAFKSELPGRVDLWPVVERAQDEDEREWTDPVDQPSARQHAVILAEEIAAQIKKLTEGEHFIPEDGAQKNTFAKRQIRAGDFLILVQSRGTLFSEIIRACKAAQLPIAGADRLKVGAELAVKDLASLLSFLATPDDSLSLAAALKSPLFGWSEQALFSLSHYRQEDHLWQALRQQTEIHPKTLSILQDLRGQVDFLRPYDLVERILTRHNGRARLLARLGPEAEDGINALLSQALAYERTDIPSLTGFLEWIQTDDLVIKRQIDNSSDQIRVMSVHGSKGLEAPIVILPDTGRRNITIKDEIISMDGVPVWKASSADLPENMRKQIDLIKAAQQRERLRLLYVAMTRAEKWLMVAAAGDLSKDGSDWYQIVQGAMGHINATPVGDTGILRFQEADWDGLQVSNVPIEHSVVPALEPVFCEEACDAPERAKTLSPSDLGGAKGLPGEPVADLETTLSYGSLVHKLLENLATVDVENRHRIAQTIGKGWAEDILERALLEAEMVLDNSALSGLFHPTTLAEVPITAAINNQRLHGLIDRLVISETEVLAVDFKTNTVPPDRPETCPEGVLRQMGAYAYMLANLYPNHEIKTAIVWTANQNLMMLPNDFVTNALWRSPDLDVKGPPT